eukprot:20243-Eustigmatos_ZCMA.PRE.1
MLHAVTILGYVVTALALFLGWRYMEYRRRIRAVKVCYHSRSRFLCTRQGPHPTCPRSSSLPMLSRPSVLVQQRT